MLRDGRWFADSGRIDQIQLDHRFGLLLDHGTLIVIESPFVATVDGVVTEVIPETLEHVEPASAALHRELSELHAFRSGALRIVLVDEGLIEVPPGDGYEILVRETELCEGSVATTPEGHSSGES